MTFRRDRKLHAWVCLWLVIAFGLGEVAVRMLASTEEPELIVPSANDQLVYELNAQRSGINSFGMRGEEFALEDLHGKYVIVVIGDSHTYSSKVEQASGAFPQQLERHLSRLARRGQVAVLNMGVLGYNTAQELEVLRAKALQFSPNLVILQYCINDTHVCNYLQPEHQWLNRLVHKSHLLVLAWKGLLYSGWGQRHLMWRLGTRWPDTLLFQEGLVGTLSSNVEGEAEAHRHHPARTKARVPARYHDMLGRENWERRTQEFAAICQRATIPVIATGFIEEEDRAVFSRAGFTVYSFFDMIDRGDMAQYGYDPARTDSHFEADGSERIGRALAEFISARHGADIDEVGAKANARGAGHRK